ILCCVYSSSLALFAFTSPSTYEIHPPSLHDALPIFGKERVGWMEDYLTTPESSLAALSCVAQFAVAIRAKDDASPFYQRMLAERSEEHTSELQSRFDLVCRLLLEKKKK